VTGLAVILSLIILWGSLNMAWWIDRRMRDKHKGNWP
jgi:hypothetical protein